MVLLHNSVLLHCTSERAFDYLSDLCNEAEWNPDMDEVHMLTDGPVGVGTKWLAKWSSAPKPVEVEMLEYDRPRKWVAHNSGPLEVTFTGRLEPEAGGVRLHVDFDARPHGPLRLFFPVLLRRLRKGETANMEYIRTALA
jgi:polyketide cyclase/dehydrase/lipid transport protein